MQRRYSDDGDDDGNGNQSTFRKFMWIVVPMILQGVVVGAIALMTFYFGVQHKLELLERRDNEIERSIDAVKKVDDTMIVQLQKVTETINVCQLTIARLQERHEIDTFERSKK